MQHGCWCGLVCRFKLWFFLQSFFSLFFMLIPWGGSCKTRLFEICWPYGQSTTMSKKKDELRKYNFIYDTRENLESNFYSIKFKFFETGKILSFCIYEYISFPWHGQMAEFHGLYLYISVGAKRIFLQLNCCWKNPYQRSFHLQLVSKQSCCS